MTPSHQSNVERRDQGRPSRELTLGEAKADIAFLLLRASAAGSCDFTGGRWTGSSSNALVSVAYGGEQHSLPYDRADYAACIRTYVRLPLHRRTAEVRSALAKAREFYLNRYPEDRYPAARKAKRAAWEEEHARRNAKRRRRA